MKKHSLNRFIEKYYLGGNCSSVVIKSDGNKLSTRFITGDKNLLGELTMSDWKFDSAELGVYNTEQLVKLLSVMSENISMDLTKAGDKVVSLKISDSASDVNYMLSDLSVINTPPNLKSIPEFEVKIKVDKSNEFIDCIVSTPTGRRLSWIQASHQFKLYTGKELPIRSM